MVVYRPFTRHIPISSSFKSVCLMELLGGGAVKLVSVGNCYIFDSFVKYSYVRFIATEISNSYYGPVTVWFTVGVL
jgi:hypothetical protein